MIGPKNTPLWLEMVYAPECPLTKVAVNVVLVIESTTTSSAAPVPPFRFKIVPGTIPDIEAGVTAIVEATIVVGVVVATLGPMGTLVPVLVTCWVWYSATGANRACLLAIDYSLLSCSELCAVALRFDVGNGCVPGGYVVAGAPLAFVFGRPISAVWRLVVGVWWNLYLEWLKFAADHRSLVRGCAPLSYDFDRRLFSLPGHSRIF